VSKHGQWVYCAGALLDLHLSCGDKTGVFADCRGPNHRGLATVEEGGLRRGIRLSLGGKREIGGQGVLAYSVLASGIAIQGPSASRSDPRGASVRQ
jgi:hypothetical protein